MVTDCVIENVVFYKLPLTQIQACELFVLHCSLLGVSTDGGYY